MLCILQKLQCRLVVNNVTVTFSKKKKQCNRYTPDFSAAFSGQWVH
jgi:hypothetical protein